MASDIPIRFPPLPEMPQPPTVGPDPRQAAFRGIVDTNGIAVEIEAQDDHGYYRYSFDLMLREAPAT